MKIADWTQFAGEFERVLQQLDTLGSQYAEARAKSWLLQEQAKIVKAVAFKAATGTMAEREALALTDLAYRDHLTGTAVAIQTEHRLKAEYTRWQAEFEALRSLQSFEKAKMSYV